MANRAEDSRRQVAETGSPLKGHSLNQRKIGYDRVGSMKLFGIDQRQAQAKSRREEAKEVRKQALLDSSVRLLDGRGTEEDIVIYRFYLEEFEQVDKDEVRASVLNFEGLSSTDSSYGEPQFFRKNGNSGK